MGILAVGYLLLMHGFLRAWLVCLPSLLAVTDLTLYSGRLYIDEFDILVLLTAGALFLHVNATEYKEALTARSMLLMHLMGGVTVISTLIFLFPWPGITPNSLATAVSPLNALREAKGFFWAWLLFPFLKIQYDQNPTRTRDFLIAGIIAGVILLGIGILWERGVFLSLVSGKGIYGFLATLLDFSSTYRVTGLFSSMHTGGTAIDAYMALVLPLTLAPLLLSRSPWVKLFAVGCFLFGTYGLMVTFSRALYLGFFISLLMVGIFLVYQNRRSFSNVTARHLTSPLLAFFVFSVLFLLLFQMGGLISLGGGLFLMAACSMATALFKADRKVILGIAIALIATAGGYIIFKGIIGSRWSEAGPLEAVLGTFAAAIVLPALTVYVTPPLRHRDHLLNLGMGLMILVVLWAGTIPATFGYRMFERFSTTSEDMDTRQHHWTRTLKYMDDGIGTHLFGMGVGSFPYHFFINNIGTFPLVRYSLGQDQNDHYLTLSSGGYGFNQKISLAPDSKYTLRIRTRSNSAHAHVGVKLCHKHILYSERYMPSCPRVIIRHKTAGEWQQHEHVFESRGLGRWGLFYWPTTMIMGYVHPERPIDITDVQLIDAKGRNILNNGRFVHGTDRWIMVTNWEHLSWHPKNMFLYLYFEYGLIGLGVFLILVSAALLRQLRELRQGSSMAPFLIAAISSFMLVGLFGTLLDVPRVATLFYLVVTAAMIDKAMLRAPIHSSLTTDDHEPTTSQ